MSSTYEFDDSKMLNELESKILSVIRIFNRPTTPREIADEIVCPLPTVKKALNSLVYKGCIVMYQSGDKKGVFYAPLTNKQGIEEILMQKYVDLASPLDEKYNIVVKENNRLKSQIRELNDSISKLYANLLTLMGIFVALFSIIVINISAINSFAENVIGVKAMFLDLLILNIPVIVTIAALLLMIKHFLLPKSVHDEEK